MGPGALTFRVSREIRELPASPGQIIDVEPGDPQWPVVVQSFHGPEALTILRTRLSRLDCRTPECPPCPFSPSCLEQKRLDSGAAGPLTLLD